MKPRLHTSYLIRALVGQLTMWLVLWERDPMLS